MPTRLSGHVSWPRRLDAMAAMAVAWVLASVAGAATASVLDTQFSSTELDRMCIAPKQRINVQLMWADRVNADLDLHVNRPDGAHVYYRNRGFDRCQGVLDHDRLEGSRFDAPETFFAEFENCSSVGGNYQVWVNYFSGRLRRVPFTLTIRVGDNIQLTCRGLVDQTVAGHRTLPIEIPADLAGAGAATFILPQWCR